MKWNTLRHGVSVSLSLCLSVRLSSPDGPVWQLQDAGVHGGAAAVHQLGA